MHTFKGKKVNIFHNGDLSGEVEILDKETGNSIKVDSEDILKFVAEHIRSEKIGKYESMDYKELLGL